MIISGGGHLSGEHDTQQAGKRRQARIGAPDRSLTPDAGLAVVSELCSRLGLIGALDAAVGPIKQRERGHGAGGAAGRDRGGAARRGGLPDRAGPPASRCGRAAAHAGAGAELHHRRGPGPPDHPRSVAGSGRRSGGRDRADAGTAPGAGIIAKEHGRTPADDAQEIRPSTSPAALGVPPRTARTRPALRARRHPEGADPQRSAPGCPLMPRRGTSGSSSLRQAGACYEDSPADYPA